MRNKLVSVITPTYNHEKFISKCIESVLTQSYSKWEMIIIDDCSDDNTYRIAQAYAKNDKRIRVVRHSKRWGIQKLKQTYNQALKKSRGKLIAILEGDDYWQPQKLDVQVRLFQNSKTVLSYADAITINSIGKKIRIVNYMKNTQILNNKPVGALLEAFFDINFFLEPVTVVIRKSALVQAGGFRSSKYYPFVDFPTWFALSLTGNFRYVPEILGYYRKHKNSSWFSFASNTKSMGREEVIQSLVNFIEISSIKVKNLALLKCNSRTQLIKKMNRKKMSMLLNKLVFYSGGELYLDQSKILPNVQKFVFGMVIDVLFTFKLLRYNLLKRVKKLQ